MIKKPLPILCLSFSGGRTSAFMCWWAKKYLSHLYQIVVVFANTGKEREETLEFVRKCDEEFGFDTVWIEAVIHPEHRVATTHRIVNFETASRNGEPFEAVILKYGMPNIKYPHCSREMKAQAIRSYMRSITDTEYFTAIGIRSDEPRRLNWVKAKEENLMYILATHIRITKADINKFWSEQNFDLQLKSYEGNCDLCFKKTLRKLLTIAKDNPTLTTWWDEIGEKYKNYIPPNREQTGEGDFRFFRDGYTMKDIVEEAHLPFRPSRDESQDLKFQTELWETDYDSFGGCAENCEAF